MRVMIQHMDSTKLATSMTLAIACVLAGCASKPAYNSTTGKGGVRSTQIITDSKGVPNQYQVKQGDTVGKIAQRYGLDWREIGRINNLNSNYTIYTGQWLTLWTGSLSARDKANKATTSQPARAQVTQTTTKAPTPPPTPTRTQPPAVSTGTSAAPFATGSSGVMQFRYPVGTNNPVVRRFGTHNINGQQVSSNGMWFSGSDGDAVQASRAGTVVQVDDGRVADSAIIIQHPEGFTSTYVYVKDARVKNGDSVSQGQRIASMKSQPSGVALFEFRIARNNIYVDPLTVLK